MNDINVGAMIDVDRYAVEEMALAMQEMSCPIRIGQILEYLQNKWEAQEKETANTAKRKREHPYNMRPFPWDAAKAEIIRRYPWTDPYHPDNPSIKFFRRQMQNIARAREQGSEALKMSGPQRGYT